MKVYRSHFFRHLSFLLFLGFFISSNILVSQTNTTVRISAGYINNFIKLIEWPQGALQDTFKIGIVQSPEIAKWVTTTMSKNSNGIKGIPVKVDEIESLENAKDYSVLYVNIRNKYLPPELFNAIGNDPILLITEGYDVGTTMINFVIQNNRLSYEVNVLPIEIRKLVMDNKLLDNSIQTGEKEGFQKMILDMRKKLNITLDKNEEQTKKIQSLNKSIAQKEAAIRLKEKYLDSIRKNIQLQKIQSDKLRATLDSNKAEIRAKEQALSANDAEIEKQIQEINKAKKDFAQIQSKMTQTVQKLDNQKTFLTISVLVSILIAILLIIAYRSSVKQRKQAVIISRQKEEAEIQRDEIQTQHLELADKNKEITDSITYAKRIQDAMLPPLDVFYENLTKSFVFYLPKDIVAGDFYWMEKVGDKIIFAAADCTGHGVPGAIVSVICSNALNRSVREFKLTKPSEILDQTLEIVLDKFSTSEDEVKDGMDIALCTYNPKTHELEYAGANNPLWIIRKGSDKIEEYKANKQPIGKYLKHTPFVNHKTILEPGDTMYVFSDGYADQFGGELGKKFRSIHFKELLLSIQKEDMQTQKRKVEKAFFGWKGNLEQLDDICVIGYQA